MKIYLGLALAALACVVSSTVAIKPIANGEYQAPWSNADPKYDLDDATNAGRAVQLTPASVAAGYNGNSNCGLSNHPAFVQDGCVFMGPESGIDTVGVCGAQNSGGYFSWCENCYDFPGQKFLGVDVGTTYTDVIGVSSDTTDACAKALSGKTGDCDCEFNTDNCPTVVDKPNSCWTSSNIKTDCLANTPHDFDFTPLNGGTAMHGLVNHCCGLVEEEYTNPEPTIVDCFDVVHNPETGCIESADWNEGKTCYPVPGNSCIAGTCQTIDEVQTCASAPVTCDDGNDCTIDQTCNQLAEKGEECGDGMNYEAEGAPCRSAEACVASATCNAEGVCANTVPVECPEGATCDPDVNQCVQVNESDLLPLGLAAAGGLCCLGAAAAILAKKRKDVLEESKRDSMATQKTDNAGRGAFGGDARKSGMSAVTSFSRAPGAAGGASGGVDFDQVSHATRRSDAVSVQSRVSRVSDATRNSRNSRSSSGRGSSGRRSSSGRGSSSRRGSDKYDFKSSGTRSSSGRSSQSRSRNSQGTRSSGSRSRSTGSRGRH